MNALATLFHPLAWLRNHCFRPGSAVFQAFITFNGSVRYPASIAWNALSARGFELVFCFSLQTRLMVCIQAKIDIAYAWMVSLRRTYGFPEAFGGA